MEITGQLVAASMMQSCPFSLSHKTMANTPERKWENDSCVTFLLYDTGWYADIHQNVWAPRIDRTKTHTTHIFPPSDFSDDPKRKGGTGPGPSCVACPSGSRTATAGATNLTSCECGPGHYFVEATGLCEVSLYAKRETSRERARERVPTRGVRRQTSFHPI